MLDVGPAAGLPAGTCHNAQTRSLNENAARMSYLPGSVNCGGQARSAPAASCSKPREARGEEDTGRGFGNLGPAEANVVEVRELPVMTSPRGMSG